MTAGLREVADDVFLVAHAHTNCYLIRDAGAVTLVDSGLPGGWAALLAALRALATPPEKVAALLITHGHFDHVGTARRLHRDHGVPVWLHPDDRYIARHPYRYEHESVRIRYPLTKPKAVPILASMTFAGALGVRGVEATNLLLPGQAVPVPGSPIPILSPGHTAGHCAFHLPERDVLIAGDAVVTLDPYTGNTGPRIVAGAATANSARALSSLQALEATGARIVLTGHGEPWRSGIAQAVTRARAAGPA